MPTGMSDVHLGSEMYPSCGSVLLCLTFIIQKVDKLFHFAGRLLVKTHCKLQRHLIHLRCYDQSS